MASLCTSNLTSGFIDLATYDEQERYLYGSDDQSFTYFVREHHKATWFTQVPVCLSKSSGTADFGSTFSVTISRAGDYLLQTWLRAKLPAITLTTQNVQGRYIRWTANPGHNLIKECTITFNDLVAARFDSYHLDFWTAFTVDASKRQGYDNMIGNVDVLVNNPSQTSLPEYIINVPLPFFFSRDTGVALPTAALPYNDMRINIEFRNWYELLVVHEGSNVYPANGYVAGNPSLGNSVNVWANYAIVANDERKKMACAARDILIEQVQTAPIQNLTANNLSPQVDIRFSHAIKVLFFAARNKNVQNPNFDWSNYTTRPKQISAGILVDNVLATDPMADVSLIYENTQRLYRMGTDYFSLVQPWYHAPAIPEVTGYHMYSYSLDFFGLDPMGSTNYGKLTNVTLAFTLSPDVSAENSSVYDLLVTAVNNNVVRVAGGTLGFPVL